MDLIFETLGALLGISAEILEASSALLGIIVAGFSATFGFPLAMLLYRKRQFLDHITYSCNTLLCEDDTYTLQIRTPEVLPVSDLLPVNTVFSLKLLLAIRRCTSDNPFIIMSDRDMDVLQPCIINGLSRIFAEGIMANAQGRVVEKTIFLIAITFEKYGAIRSRKIRVMIATANQLQQISKQEFRGAVRFEEEHHSDRMRTLYAMAERYQLERSNNFSGPRIIREVEGMVVVE